jgi:predicted PurR-regulated permease PerM
MNFNNRKGVAALITVLSFSTLVFILSLSTAAVTFWGVKNIDSNQKSLKAYYAAYSGTQDALLRLERNKDFSGDFNLSINSTNDVSVSVANNDGQAIITVTSVFGQVNKKIQTVSGVDSTTGLVTSTSTTELTI